MCNLFNGVEEKQTSKQVNRKYFFTELFSDKKKATHSAISFHSLKVWTTDNYGQKRTTYRE